MPKQSAGLLVYRYINKDGCIGKYRLLEVFLAHMGGPFWMNKDEGAWTIPKGEFGEGEDAFKAAKREFKEEIGVEINGEFIELKTIKQAGGKVVYAWAIGVGMESEISKGELRIKSNTFSIEWPPRSGQQQKFPEIDRAAWFGIDEAGQKILKSQKGLLDELMKKLDVEEGVIRDEDGINKNGGQIGLF